MMMPAAIVAASLTVFGTIAVGAVARKLGWLTEEADQSLARLIVNLLMPALIFDKLLGNPVLDRTDNLILAPLVGAGTICLGFVVAGLAARLGRVGDTRVCRTFSFSVGMYNYSYIPLLLTVALFDRETVGVLFLHNLGVETAMWTVGVMLLRAGGTRFEWRSILNGPVLGVIAGVGVTRLGWAGHVPDVMVSIIHGLGACTIPLALVATGAIIMDLIRPGLFLEGKRSTGLAVVVRLAVMPVMMLGLLFVVPGSTELMRVIAIEAAMPCAVFPIVMSRHFGGDVPTAVRALVVTSALSILTTPLWLSFGLHLLR